MKDLDIGVLFCEVLSGLVLILLIVGSLDLANKMDAMRIVAWGTSNSSGWTIAGLLLAAYLVGIIVDAVGVTFDIVVDAVGPLKKALSYDAGKMPKAFYATATEHQLSYWRKQWSYFSCYRNLLLLSPMWAGVGIGLASKYGDCAWIIVTSIICVVIVSCLVVTIRMLQRTLVSISAPIVSAK